MEVLKDMYYLMRSFMLDIGILAILCILSTVYFIYRIKLRDKMKERDGWEIWLVIGVICWGGLAYFSIPYVQDFTDQKTTVIVGEVVNIVEPYSKKFNFQYTYEIATPNGNIKVRSEKDSFHLEIGKTYEIECFTHTKTPISVNEMNAQAEIGIVFPQLRT